MKSTKDRKRIDRSDDLLSINVWEVLNLIQRHWYLYLTAFLFFGGGGYLYLKYKIPTYNVYTTVLIEEPEALAGQNMLQGFAVTPGSQNLDNQILIFSSYTMVGKTVEELPFEIDVYRKGLFSQASYYPLSPIKIEAGASGLPVGIEFEFQYEGDRKYLLKTTGNSVIQLDTTLRFGQNIQMDVGSFTIYPQSQLSEIYESGEKIYLKFYDKERLTFIYKHRLVVEKATQDGTIVQISLSGTNRVKDIIFLDKLTQEIINYSLEKKNQEAKRTIEFINEQLTKVTDSLMLTENRLQEFRSRERIMDVSAQSQQIIDQAVVLDNEKAKLTLESNYYNYLEEYLSQDDNVEAPMAPASMGIEDPLLANLMQELAGLQSQYYSSGVGQRNPLQGQLQMRIKNTKNSIKETLQGIKLANQMAIDENDQQIRRLNSQATKLPEKERQLLGFERKFNLNNVLYNFLLQSRAEAQIQRASNTPDNELIDPARSIGPVSPKSFKVFGIALALALLLPTLILILRDAIQRKVINEDDFKFLGDIPVVGHFPHSRLSYNTVVLNEPESGISEAFRSLRTRMEFIVKESKCPLILVTSSMPGEGKTFSAINIASAYSLMGKKTLLVGFDLRRPTLAISFTLKGDVGLSNYLIGKNKIDEVIFETGYENLDIIPSGPIPPNPGELSSSKEARELFVNLRKRYDFIIVDSAPMGIVSDIYPIASMADSVLLIVRHRHTRKDVLRAAISEAIEYGVPHLSVLVNDIKSKGTSYHYTYKYKYGYESKNVMKRTLRVFNKKG